jgi:hypothetical protein
MKDGEAVQGFAQLSDKINRIIGNEMRLAFPRRAKLLASTMIGAGATPH